MSCQSCNKKSTPPSIASKTPVAAKPVIKSGIAKAFQAKSALVAKPAISKAVAVAKPAAVAKAVPDSKLIKPKITAPSPSKDLAVKKIPITALPKEQFEQIVGKLTTINP